MQHVEVNGTDISFGGKTFKHFKLFSRIGSLLSEYYPDEYWRSTDKHKFSHYCKRFNDEFDCPPKLVYKIINGSMKRIWYHQPYSYCCWGNIYYLKNLGIFQEKIRQLEKDNLKHLIPFAITLGQDPQRGKQYYGKSVWKRLTKQCFTRNLYFAKFAEKCTPAEWEVLLNLPTKHLKSLRRNQSRYAVYGLRDFGQTSFLLEDTYMRFKDEGRKVSLKGWTHERIVEYHNSRIVRKYPVIEKLEPFEYTNKDIKIKLLTTSEEVVAEGTKMHHCVASYIPSIARGDLKVYHVEYKNEPATLAINPYGDLHQMRGIANRSLNFEFHEIRRYLSEKETRSQS